MRRVLLANVLVAVVIGSEVLVLSLPLTPCHWTWMSARRQRRCVSAKCSRDVFYTVLTIPFSKVARSAAREYLKCSSAVQFVGIEGEPTDVQEKGACKG